MMSLNPLLQKKEIKYKEHKNPTVVLKKWKMTINHKNVKHKKLKPWTQECETGQDAKPKNAN